MSPVGARAGRRGRRRGGAGPSPPSPVRSAVSSSWASPVQSRSFTKTRRRSRGRPAPGRPRSPRVPSRRRQRGRLPSAGRTAGTGRCRRRAAAPVWPSAAAPARAAAAGRRRRAAGAARTSACGRRRRPAAASGRPTRWAGAQEARQVDEALGDAGRRADQGDVAGLVEAEEPGLPLRPVLHVGPVQRLDLPPARGDQQQPPPQPQDRTGADPGALLEGGPEDGEVERHPAMPELAAGAPSGRSTMNSVTPLSACGLRRITSRE